MDFKVNNLIEKRRNRDRTTFILVYFDVELLSKLSQTRLERTKSKGYIFFNIQLKAVDLNKHSLCLVFPWKRPASPTQHMSSGNSCWKRVCLIKRNTPNDNYL